MDARAEHAKLIHRLQKLKLLITRHSLVMKRNTMILIRNLKGRMQVVLRKKERFGQNTRTCGRTTRGSEGRMRLG